MRKLLSGILIIIICSISIYSFAENEIVQNQVSNNQNTVTANSTSSNSNISNLQQQQQEIQTQLQQSNEDLTDVQDELSDNLQQIQKLDEKIENAQIELEQTIQKIEELSKTIENLQDKLKIVREKYEKQKKLAEARLIAMYEAGETEYLDVMLSSTDLSDFLSSYAMLTELASYDKELLDNVEEKKQIVELVDQKLSNNLEQLNVLQKNQKLSTQIMQNTKILRENYVAKLTEQEKQIQAKIDEYKFQFEQVNKEIIQTAMSEGLIADYIGGVMAWPVPGYTKISSNYGMRTHPITGIYKLHTGVDISAPMGANFVAANDGIVTKAYYNSAYGNMVMIDHGGGISTLYAHGSQILVNVGQAVTKGEPVLKVGSTGYSTGPHAHFEVRINGVVTNPIEYITSSKIPETAKKTVENTTNTNQTNTVAENGTNTTQNSTAVENSANTTQTNTTVEDTTSN